jgi:maltose-binding protein MalE
MGESCSWLFVENVPLLYEKEKVARQLKVETWLDLTQLLKELKDEDTDKKSPQQAINYVV